MVTNHSSDKTLVHAHNVCFKILVLETRDPRKMTVRIRYLHVNRENNVFCTVRKQLS